MDKKQGIELAKEISTFCKIMVKQVRTKKGAVSPVIVILPSVALAFIGAGIKRGGFWDAETR